MTLHHRKRSDVHTFSVCVQHCLAWLKKLLTEMLTGCLHLKFLRPRTLSVRSSPDLFALDYLHAARTPRNTVPIVSFRNHLRVWKQLRPI